MAIKFADEIIEEIKNRQPDAVTDASANGDEYERWLYEEDKEKKMNRITINGKTITCSGTNVIINNGKVIIDGKTIQECNNGDIKVTIEGDVNKNEHIKIIVNVSDEGETYINVTSEDDINFTLSSKMGTGTM